MWGVRNRNEGQTRPEWDRARFGEKQKSGVYTACVIKSGKWDCRDLETISVLGKVLHLHKLEARWQNVSLEGGKGKN
jgi:hypothetical protein